MPFLERLYIEIRPFLSSVLNFFSFSFSSPFDSRLCVQTVGKFLFLVRSSLQPPHLTRSVSLTHSQTHRKEVYNKVLAYIGLR